MSSEEEMREAQEVAVLTNQAGWEYIKKFIESNMRPVEKRLFEDDLEKEEFKACQRERQAYKSVLDFVNRRVKKVEENKRR